MYRVGLCEDDSAILRIASDVLRFAEHAVVTAHNGDEAVRRFSRASKIDALTWTSDGS